jgi:hypothetical protein
MATALAATFQAGTLTDPARVLLQVTGAPTLTPPYTSNFATADGWTAGTGAASVTPTAGTLRLLTNTDTAGIFDRTVTGLTVGQTYSFSLMANRASGKILLAVAGQGNTAYFQPTVGVRTALSFSFTATLTSHIIRVQLQPPVTIGADVGDYAIDTVVVARTSGWLGTTIRRTDANGTSVVVREGPSGQDTTGTTGSGVMTVTDYEAALTGTVNYTVTDGNGVTANASVGAVVSPGLWFTLPATSNPATPTPPTFVQATMVTSFDEAADSNGSIHKIIGRADPVTNPGPLSTRSGSMAVWCTDYAAAVALRKLLANGAVAQLRQPSYPGMDMYFVGTRVRIAPEDITASQRWMATLDYTEVVVP